MAQISPPLTLLALLEFPCLPGRDKTRARFLDRLDRLTMGTPLAGDGSLEKRTPLVYHHSTTGTRRTTLHPLASRAIIKWKRLDCLLPPLRGE